MLLKMKNKTSLHTRCPAVGTRVVSPGVSNGQDTSRVGGSLLLARTLVALETGENLLLYRRHPLIPLLAHSSQEQSIPTLIQTYNRFNSIFLISLLLISLIISYKLFKRHSRSVCNISIGMNFKMFYVNWLITNLQIAA